MRVRVTILTVLLATTSYCSVSLQAQSNVSLWGTVSRGGTFSNGSIFKVDGNGGNDTSVHSFYATQGNFPMSGLTLANNGLLYGTTAYGGNSNFGIIYSIDPLNGSYVKRYDFNSSNGAYPSDKLILSPNGKLYGTTQTGGAFSSGVLFEFDPSSNQYSVLHHFYLNGGSPYCALCFCSNGLIYGTTTWGAAFNYNVGVIFTYNLTTAVYTVVHEFDILNGARPEGGLVEASDGRLYGMTKLGGVFNQGVIYSVDTATNNFTKLFDFDSINGRRPVGDLVEVSGVLYGMSAEGGTNDYGVIFSWQIAIGTFTNLFDLSGTSGAYPQGSFIHASDGQLYATTSGAGLHGNGTVIRVDPSDDSCFIVFSFDSTIGFQAMSDLCEVPLDVSVAQLSSDEVTPLIYPNPSQGIFTCMWNKTAELEITYSVVNPLGQVVRSGDVHSSTLILDLSAEPSGTFFLSYTFQEMTRVEKIVKL